MRLDIIEKWLYEKPGDENGITVTSNNKTNKIFFPINLKKINNDNYKIPFNFKFFDLEPTLIFGEDNYIKTVLTFELLGKYIREGKKDKKPIKEKYDSFITIKREPNYDKLFYYDHILQNINIRDKICKVFIKAEKTHFDVKEEIPFEINIDNQLDSIGISKIIAYILRIKELKKKDKSIDSTIKFKYDQKEEKIKILPGYKGWFKYKLKIDNNKDKNNFYITSNGTIITNNYFICVELKFEKIYNNVEVKLPIFIGINKQNFKPMEFEVVENNFSNNNLVNFVNFSNNNIIQIKNEKELYDDNMVYGFENINYLNN